MLKDAEQNRLIYEAMLIVSGETMKKATEKHLQALLEERTDLIAALGTACDGLADAKACLYGKEKQWAEAAHEDSLDQFNKAQFLKKLDPNWASKVLHADDERKSA